MSRNISNSEVTSWLTCRRQYVYAFMLNLAPKVTAVPLARGTLGHLYFQRYAEARLQGHTHDASLKAANTVWIAEMNNGVGMEVIMETKYLCERYMAFHNGWPEWEILGTEQAFDAKINDDIAIPMRYDLYVRERQTGKVMLVDFKFTYEFWSYDDHSLNGQFPKYIAVMQNAGMQVDGAYLEEIRTRKLSEATASDPKKLWRRTGYFPSIAKKRELLKQHIGASLEITDFRAMGPAEQKVRAIPVLNKHGACKYCNFKDLCISELDGGEIAIAIEMGYTENTYGYNKTEIEPPDIKELI